MGIGGMGLGRSTLSQLWWYFTTAFQQCPSPCEVSHSFFFFFLIRVKGLGWIPSGCCSPPGPMRVTFSKFFLIYSVRKDLQKTRNPFWPQTSGASHTHTSPHLSIERNSSEALVPGSYGLIAHQAASAQISKRFRFCVSLQTPVSLQTLDAQLSCDLKFLQMHRKFVV